MDIFELTVVGLSAKLQVRELKSIDVTKAYLDRIKALEPAVGAYITVFEETALRQAELADEALDTGGAHPLCGVPIAVKDCICTDGQLTTCGSRMLSNYKPPYDAACVERLHEAGMVILGKTNMDECAMGSSTESSYFHTTKNPYDLTRIPGGSSGGSAAAVAARLAPIALGSDTGGSIRQPAAMCGVFGMKPTYGAISRFGLIPMASSFDQVGVVAQSAQDAALLLSLLSGHDERDATSIQSPPTDYAKGLGDSIAGLRIGLPREYFGAGISNEVKTAVMNAAKELEKQGASLAECSLPLAEFALPTYYLMSSAEASSNLARYDGVRFGYRAKDFDDYDDMFTKTRSEGFGREVKRRIMLGAFVLSSGFYDAYYRKAQQARTLLMQDFKARFSEFDLLITPTTPVTAWKLGEKLGDPLSMYAADVCTVSVNIAGLPALSLPVGVDAGGLPIGMQLIGDQLSDALVLRAAQSYETAAGHIAPPALEV